ncbi:MAG: MGMT family protein [Candidatus Paceibacterota bacterium]
MFTEKVLSIVKKIPKGETLSYKEVAELAGSPKAYRKVGSLMKANYDESIPCHRVIKSDGSLGEYNRGVDVKYKKLKAEGAF